ncbi:DUF2293 domain-containing protein [Amycolatopsis rhizosphaerae]|uniref:DUF2293 domain-containing protein n=1 Tax=Amycolatopsis rhizosphaerae TaxID=2053003 RepID=A0A558B2R0_9PSEU|nr:DUF2293 domain-containing protein [Amycolatopsis rhizosphaerae]TVT30800.1 DUF2293 domain-containing protein [Amycolatopsis rhizosphaerae]
MSDKPKLQQRVTEAAEAALRARRYVAPVDVLVALGWLTSVTVEDWRHGRTGPLAEALPVPEPKARAALDHLRDWARQRGLDPSEAGYLAGTRDKRPLVFTDDEVTQRAFRTHWVSPGLSEKQRERLEERQNKAPDLVVLVSVDNWVCAGCGVHWRAGVLRFMEDDASLCLSCADFDHLLFLPSGNAALSRRAKKESTLSALVMRFNRRRKRYERQGILVERAALERAEDQCLADEDIRARRRERDAERRAEQDVEFQAAMAAEIRRLFPGCPPDRARAIAEHAGTRGSGRIGRTAAGRALDENAVRLAVIASVRHENTDYDALLMAGVPRTEARERIWPDIERLITGWERPKDRTFP